MKIWLTCIAVIVLAAGATARLHGRTLKGRDTDPEDDKLGHDDLFKILKTRKPNGNRRLTDDLDPADFANFLPYIPEKPKATTPPGGPNMRSLEDSDYADLLESVKLPFIPPPGGNRRVLTDGDGDLDVIVDQLGKPFIFDLPPAKDP